MAPSKQLVPPRQKQKDETQSLAQWMSPFFACIAFLLIGVSTYLRGGEPWVVVIYGASGALVSGFLGFVIGSILDNPQGKRIDEDGDDNLPSRNQGSKKHQGGGSGGYGDAVVAIGSGSVDGEEEEGENVNGEEIFLSDVTGVSAYVEKDEKRPEDPNFSNLEAYEESDVTPEDESPNRMATQPMDRDLSMAEADHLSKEKGSDSGS